MKRTYGWRPDVPDHRDINYSITAPIALPASVDLRAGFPQPCYDQGQLGSCTANAIAAAIQYDMQQQHGQLFMPSRLFIYFNERSMEHTINTDAGAQIRDGIKVVNKLGVCPEKEWPYIAGRFTHKPTLNCYRDAKKDVVTQYSRLDGSNIKALKTCLAQGFPFVFGFSVYDGFESDAVAATGVLDLPAKGEKMQGGHAVCCCGYDDATQRVLVRNSWGCSWGQQGYFTMPYSYITNPHLADDFWTIRSLSK